MLYPLLYRALVATYTPALDLLKDAERLVAFWAIAGPVQPVRTPCSQLCENSGRGVRLGTSGTATPPVSHWHRPSRRSPPISFNGFISRGMALFSGLKCSFRVPAGTRLVEPVDRTK